MPQRAKRPETRPAKEKTTINLDVALKKAAKKLAIDRGVDLQDLVADGLRHVLAQQKGGPR